MSRKSSEMPPRGALTWPSSEVPTPNGITGTRAAAHNRTTHCTSSVVCGNTTASGGWFAIQVTVLPCCSRTAWEVTRRLPNCAASAAITPSTALRSRFCSVFASANAIAGLASLFGPEARCFNSRRPFLRVVLLNVGEGGGGGSGRLQSERQEPMFHVGRVHRVDDHLVEPFDDIRRRLRRREHAVPAGRDQIIA